MATEGRFFQSTYEGERYRQVYRLDPRLLIPGAMILLTGLPLVAITWPIHRTLLIPALGAALIGTAFIKRHEFEVSPEGFRFRWSFGPLGWTSRMASDEARVIARRGRRGTYHIFICRGVRTYEAFIEASSQVEAERWVRFLTEVSHGQSPPAMPES